MKVILIFIVATIGMTLAYWASSQASSIFWRLVIAMSFGGNLATTLIGLTKRLERTPPSA